MGVAIGHLGDCAPEGNMLLLREASNDETAAAQRGSAKEHVLLLLGLFVWLAATAWMRPLSLPDEGRYVGVAWEMLRSGDWLVPTLDTLPYFHKPPLFYWMSAASMAMFGVNAWAARLPSLLAAVGSAYALLMFVRRWADAEIAWVMLGILATTPFFYGGAQFANLDMLVAACMALTILSAADAVLAARDGQPHRQTLAAAYVFAALGLLAKGLIGIVIPGIVIVVWLMVSAQRAMVLRLVWLPGLALFALIAVPWFAAMQVRYPGFFQYFFIHHHFERYTSNDFNSQLPFWFFIPVFLGVTLPWSVFLATAARAKDTFPVPRRAARSLMATWLLATLVFFSIPSSKLVGYVLVAVLPFAYLAAYGLLQRAGDAGKARTLVMRNALIGVALCAAALAGALLFQRDDVGAQVAKLHPLRGVAADRILALNGYPFSLAFYLQLRQPIYVADAWDEKAVMARDNWRRELFEAARFAPARGKELLIKPEAAARMLRCSDRTVWVLASQADVARHPELKDLEQIATASDALLLRSPAVAASQRALDCGP
jgi:4-amino-4-deoxy-L-arabinose transferase-like glycosyltransferase